MHTDSTKLTDTAKLLKECDAGTKMAISSINEILEKVEDPKLNEILTHSRNAHEQLESEIHSLLNYHVSYEANNRLYYTSFSSNLQFLDNP